MSKAKPQSFAATLKVLRKKAGLTLEALAVASGLTRQGLSLYERGERAPTWEAVQKLATALNVSTDSFRSK